MDLMDLVQNAVYIALSFDGHMATTAIGVPCETPYTTYAAIAFIHVLLSLFLKIRTPKW